MTAAELWYGVQTSAFPDENTKLLHAFLATLPVIQSDSAIAMRFGSLKASLRGGALLPDADVFIAATALCHADLLVTGNTRHFARFPSLALENWIRA